MKRSTPRYHTSTPTKRLRFERACVLSLNRWAEVLDIESWDLDFIPLYGKKAKEYNKKRGQVDSEWAGFHVTMDAAYRRATVRAVVTDPKVWHMDEEELDRITLHELIHVVMSPVKEEIILPYAEGNDDRMREYRYLDEHITSQLERSIYRVAGPTRAIKKTLSIT